MEDIVERIRFAADDTDAVENASVAYLLEDAAAEIHRLRLTDEEREAIAWASKILCVGWHDLAADDKQRTREAAATLQSLLDRMA